MRLNSKKDTEWKHFREKDFGLDVNLDKCVVLKIRQERWER